MAAVQQAKRRDLKRSWGWGRAKTQAFALSKMGVIAEFSAEN